MRKNPTRPWLVTGPRAAGKTSFCRLIAGHARSAGWDVAGLLSPAVFHAGIKTGIQAQDLRTEEKRELANAEPCNGFNLKLGRWCFDRASMEWGSRVLERSLPCDLLIVDELGPLELLHDSGWFSALTVLQQPACRLSLVVVRPELLANFEERILAEPDGARRSPVVGPPVGVEGFGMLVRAEFEDVGSGRAKSQHHLPDHVVRSPPVASGVKNPP